MEPWHRLEFPLRSRIEESGVRKIELNIDEALWVGVRCMPVPQQPDVPILIETPSRKAFPMVRCHYLSVECDDPRSGWRLELQGMATPFLMLNLVGIVQQPFGATRFNNYSLIDGFFQVIEDQADLTINFEDLWLPEFLFLPKVAVGDVYRVGIRLFTVAYQYRDGRHSRD